MAFVDKKKAAEELKISEVTLDRLRKKGLPSYKAGRKVLFDMVEVENWVKNNSEKCISIFQ